MPQYLIWIMEHYKEVPNHRSISLMVNCVIDQNRYFCIIFTWYNNIKTSEKFSQPYLNTGRFLRLGRRSLDWASLKPLKRLLWRTQQWLFQKGYETKNIANMQIYWYIFKLSKLIKGFVCKKALKSVDVRKMQCFCVLLKILCWKWNFFSVQIFSNMYIRL